MRGLNAIGSWDRRMDIMPIVVSSIYYFDIVLSNSWLLGKFLMQEVLNQ